MIDLTRIARAVVVAAASLAPARAAAQPAPSPPAPPKLVVFITVDQLIPAYFERYHTQFTGGLGRLYRGGAVFTNAFQDHAITETAPGHASTMSGRFPRSTGIVANSLGVNEEHSPLIGGGGPGASPFRFRGSVLYDWMRIVDPAARALSVSRKDRGAILPMGRAGRHVYWYASNGRMTTSTWYRDTLPGWVQRFNDRRIPHSHAGKVWTPLLPDAAYAEPDSNPLESWGRDYLFPHPVPTDPVQAAGAFANYPFMDEMLAAFALEGVRQMQLGARQGSDLLAVSFSTTDAVGHQFGPDSKEVHDQVLRLDRTLGTFIDSLYRLRDSSTIAFALTADHGVGSYPAVYAQRHGRPVAFAEVRPVTEANAVALRARGLAPTALRLADEMITIDREAFRRAGVNADSALQAFVGALRRAPGVLRVDEVRALARRDTVRDAIARRWIHMLPPEWDVSHVLTVVPGALYAGSTSATHGTPHDYDAHVPVMFYGPWFSAGKYPEFARVVDMAPTLAHILRVQPTEELDGRVLARALVPGARPAAPARD